MSLAEQLGEGTTADVLSDCAGSLVCQAAALPGLVAAPLPSRPLDLAPSDPGLVRYRPLTGHQPLAAGKTQGSCRDQAQGSVLHAHSLSGRAVLCLARKAPSLSSTAPQDSVLGAHSLEATHFSLLRARSLSGRATWRIALTTQ